MNNDKIEKHVDLKAPISRVWRAISDPGEFGTWFGIRFEDPFVVGKVTRGRITIPGYEHVRGDLTIDRLDERARVIQFRWHPNAIDPAVDYTAEPMTTVTFTLSEIPTGTHLEITETGFAALPAARRAQAFTSNDGGWKLQLEHIAAYLAKQA